MPNQRDLFDTQLFSTPKTGIWLYRKESISDTSVKRVLWQVPLSYGVDCTVYTDDQDRLGAWLRLKATIENHEGGILILSSLKDIGRTIGEVADEVEWIKEKSLEVIVMDCPSTAVFEKPQLNGMIFRIVAEVWDNLMRTETLVKRKTLFPEGWDSMYREWKSGKLKTKELIAWSKLSPTTLNSRLKVYGPIADGRVDIFPLRRTTEGYEYV